MTLSAYPDTSFEIDKMALHGHNCGSYPTSLQSMSITNMLLSLGREPQLFNPSGVRPEDVG